MAGEVFVLVSLICTTYLICGYYIKYIYFMCPEPVNVVFKMTVVVV